MRTIPFALATGALAVALSNAHAQPPPPVYSLGQPPVWQPYVVGGLSWDTGPGGAAGGVTAGVLKHLRNPVTGVLAASGEGYGTVGGNVDGMGARFLARSPALALGAGVDVNAGQGRRPRLDLIFSWQSAIRRGGLFGRGTMVRIDWLPGRRQTLSAGVNVPLRQPLVGRGRVRKTHSNLPRAQSGGAWAEGPIPGDADAALARVSAASTLIRLYSTLYSARDVETLRRAPRNGFLTATRDYHAALARAFAAAAGDSSLGDPIARRARAGLFDAVLIPYDSIFGRVKSPRADLRGLTFDAQQRFARWLRDSSPVIAVARSAVLIAHARWLTLVESVHRDLVRGQSDSRFIWLPLGLSLLPEQYDEQAEVDSLIARAVGRPFTDENAFVYLRSSDLPLEIARSIFAARDYHVLWTHDFTGRRVKTGGVDNISYEMVCDVYLPALTAAVKRYDATGRLPIYMIVLDQYFYEPRIGRMWMTMLEDPLNATFDLPGRNADKVARLRERQAELRAAVAASARLQRDAGQMGGRGWLRRTVKVHVSIMQQSDFSFRSHQTIPPLPFTPDNVMRDHRKIVLYDLNETNPYGGALMIMGVGVGEYYATPTWEDRGYRVRGPAALEARAALRRLLLNSGFRPQDIPQPLRAVEDTKRAEARMNTGDYVGRALQVHNEPGFGRKQASVVRALLYDLAQPGSLVIVPDPQWLSAEWAAMLAAAAARGAMVHVITPALANAPSSQGSLMALSHEVMTRLLQLRVELAPQIRESGGALRVGIYTARATVDDPAGRRREVREGLVRAPWIRQLIPFDDQTLRVLDRAEAVSAGDGREASMVGRDEKPRAPQLHQKTQLFARRGAIAVLVKQAGWEDALAASMAVQSRQTARFGDQLGYEVPAVDSAATRRADAMLRAYEAALSEDERKRVSFYFSVGSQNQDPRSMVSDGESILILSGFQGATGLVDLFYLMTRSVWVTSQAELERFIPEPSRFMKWLAGVLRPSL